MKNAWRADPLVWGHGPRVFEVFLEPTCPFSVRGFRETRRPARRSGRGPHHRQGPPTVAALAHVLRRDRTLHLGRLDPRRRKDPTNTTPSTDATEGSLIWKFQVDCQNDRWRRANHVLGREVPCWLERLDICRVY